MLRHNYNYDTAINNTILDEKGKLNTKMIQPYTNMILDIKRKVTLFKLKLNYNPS